MLKQFANWPLDGLIVFITLILGLAGLVISEMMARDKPVTPTQGRYFLRSGLWSSIFMASFVALYICMLYAASKAENAPHMPNNRLWAGLLVISLTGGLAYMASLFFTRLGFDKEKLYVQRPFSKMRSYFWKDLRATGMFGGTAYLKFEGSGRIYRPWHKLGAAQLDNCICLQMFPLKGRRVLYEYYPETAQELRGKPVYSYVFFIDEHFLNQPFAHAPGVIESLDAEKTIIRPIDPALPALEAATNFRGITLLHPSQSEKLAREHNLEEPPQFLATWYTQDLSLNGVYPEEEIKNS